MKTFFTHIFTKCVNFGEKPVLKTQVRTHIEYAHTPISLFNKYVCSYTHDD